MRFQRPILLALIPCFLGTTMAQPIITGQVPNPILINENQVYTVQFANLTVNDVNYPTGYSFSLSPGANYSVSGNDITPDLNYSGPLSIPVTVNDGTLTSAPWDLQVLINDSPVAIDDNEVVNEDSQVNIQILSNDTDSDGSIDSNTIDLDVVTPGDQTSAATTAGSWAVVGNHVRYTPALNYNTPPATLGYTVADNQGAESNVATITVNITPLSDPPVASDDNAATLEDTPAVVTILANDSDPDGLLNINSVDLDPSTGGQQTSMSTTAGTWNVVAGVVTFAPALNYNSPPATLTYTVEDLDGDVSNTATITITITPVNDLPSVADDNATTNEDTPTTFNILTNDNDVEGLNTSSIDLDVLTGGQQTTRTTTAGTWSVVPGGNLTFTPALNYNSPPGSITYTVQDSDGATTAPATITVSITSINDLPTAGNDNTTTTEDTPVTFNILSNDSDVEGPLNSGSVDLDPSTAGQQTTRSTTAGTWSVSGGNLTFTPALNYTTPPATITYTVADADGGVSNAATITITITSDNDPPVAANDNATTNEDTPVTFNILTNDNDPEGALNTASVDLDVVTAGQQTTATTGAGTWSVSAGNLTFTPGLNYTTPPATITYTVADADGAVSNQATVTITITPVNDPPNAVNDNATTNEDTPVTFNILTNDSDPEGALNTGSVDLDVVTAGQQTTATTSAGTWSVSAGNLTFTPGLNYTTPPATLSYTVSDAGGAVSNQATITITITPVNDPPTAVNDNTSTNEDTPVTFNILTNDTDPEGALNPASVDLDVVTAGQQTTATTSAGTWSVSAGNLTFTPGLNYTTSPATLSYTVADAGGATSNVATITITINAVNDPPSAGNDVGSTLEETATTVNVLTNDSDVDGSVNPATVDLDVVTPGVQTSATSNGTWAVSGGIVTYTPALNFSGPATLSYTVQDNNGAVSNTATITITVIDTNDPPQAVDDNGSTNEEVTTTINVVSNDTDADGTVNIATVDLNTSLAGIQTTNTNGFGNWSVSTSGIVTFTPALNTSGPASITYTVNDDDGATSNIATINVTVNPVNDAPVANGDNVTTPEETPITFNVTSNDTDVDGTVNTATVDLNTSTAGIQNTNTTAGVGSWSVNASGDVTFTPVANFNGPATLTYTVNDNGGAVSNVATISVTVTPVNDPPLAANDATATNEDVAVTLNVVSNDTDPDGTVNIATVDLNTGSAGIQNTNTTAEGSWSVNGSGVVTFTPTTNYFGSAILTYTVNDNGGATSNAATITITVNSVNDVPVANDDAGSTNEETLVVINVTGNDTDIDGTINAASVDLNTATAGIQNTISNASGSYSVNSTGDVSFTPAANVNGLTTLTYRVNDNGGATSNSATLSITVNAVNDPPVAVADAVSTNEDTPVTLNVVSNDTDVDGTVNVSTVDLDPSTPGIQNSDAISGGTISVNTSGVITFTPTINFYGLATATYTVQDNNGATSNVANINITVVAVNDAPFANNDIAAADENETVTLNVVSNDFDPDGTVNPASVDLNTATAGIQTSITIAAGTFTVDATGLVTYVPTVNFNGNATITYNVRDNSGATSNNAIITITVASVNSDPIANNDAATIVEDAVATINLVANDSDPDGTINAATVDLNTSVAGIQNSLTIAEGTLTVSGTGILTFTPTPNFNGAITASYTVNDNVGATSNVATISITVTAVNDVPVANNDAATTTEGVAITLNVVANDSDVDGTIDATSVDLNTSLAGIQNTNTTAAGTFSVNTAGVVTYTPVANFNGSAVLNYRVNDNTGASSNVATITITVTSVNDAPTANNDAATTNEDVAVTVNVIANDTDVDGSIAVTTVDLNPGTSGIQNSLTTASGSYTVSPAGVVTFTPLLNFNGSAVITYTVNDNTGLTSNEATITITVTPVNDLPVANNDGTTTPEGVAVTLNVVSNDTDVDGTIDVATVDLNTSVAGIQNTNTTAAGTFTVNASGVVTFTPVANFGGVATLTYRVNDNQGATSNAATITITVDAVNDPPVANNDAATTNEDVVVTVNVIANDTDVDGTVSGATVDLNQTTAGIQNTFTVANGTFTVNTAGVVTFTPDLNENGTAVASYTVNDNGGLTSNVATITITINPVNDTPVAVNDAATTTEDNPITFNIVGNDTDPEGPLNLATIDLNTTLAGIQVTNTTTAGTFTVNATGDLTYTPVANFFGSATLTYRVNDGSGLTSNTATITITVTAVNDPPSFAVIPNQSVLRNSPPTTITVTGITAGPSETETLSWSVTSGNVSVVPNPSFVPGIPTATLTFQPVANQAGTAVITVKAVDTGSNEFTQTFTIDVVDVRFTSTPVTVAVYDELYEYPIQITPGLNPTLTIVATQKPAWATLTSTGKNQAKLSGTPLAGAPSTSPVILQVKDGATVLDQQSFTITVNHRPVVSSFNVNLNEDQVYSLEASKISAGYSDADSQPISQVLFTKLPRHGTLSIGSIPVVENTPVSFASIASVTYTPNASYNGLDTLYWKATDGQSESKLAASINFSIAPVNDPPTILSVGTDSLKYELGSEIPQILMPVFDAIDVDDDSLANAELGFRSLNFNPLNDRLIFTPTTNISGAYNEQTGTLLLNGKAPIAEYVQAIRSIQYNYVDLEEIDLVTKSVYVTLSDGKNLSETKDRYIALQYTFEALDIPNAFTPNGDHANDVWLITAEKGVDQYNDAVIRIYNKRSMLLFETKGLENPWDGTYKGDVLPPDTYYYTIDLKFNRVTYRGAVTILR